MFRSAGNSHFPRQWALCLFLSSFVTIKNATHTHTHKHLLPSRLFALYFPPRSNSSSSFSQFQLPAEEKHVGIDDDFALFYRLLQFLISL